MSLLSITFFGTFQVHFNKQPTTAFESHKARALLAYLAVESSQAHARATLAGLFWPEFRENNARNNLRHALTNLRTVLHNQHVEPPFLLSDRQTVQFNAQSSHHLDVADFTQSLERYRHNTATTEVGQNVADPIAALEHAITLYRGPFLNGLFLDDCSAFEEWLLLTRERLHNQMLTALATLVGHFEGLQAYDKAESYARQLIALDNLQEQAHCSLMRILARRGQRSAALSQYEQCRQVLATELGTPPSTETVALHQQIQRGLWETALPPTRKRIYVEPLHHPPVHSEPQQHNLPHPTTSFVGRTQEVTTICALLRQPDLRLVTLHGPGGVGKTRLALQVARQLCNEFPDGCYWVELAPLQAVSQVPTAIAQSLGISERTGHDPLQRLKDHLQSQAILLVLDNYEHLLDAALLVTELLNHVEQLKCLVTSREPLHLRGEQEFAVPALTLPTSDQLPLPANLADYEAIQLFMQRAQAVKPDFAIDHDSAAVAAQICARLDGMPLAIELAAARCKFFAPTVLLQKLETSLLSFLRGTRDMPSRHQTLRSAIAWSYDLLSIGERKLFRRLALFVGGCTVEAAEYVCALEGDDTLDLLETLISLVDKSLVRQEIKADGESRFLLLETIHEFATEQLVESGELWAIQQSHTNYYDELASTLCPQLMGANGLRCLSQLRSDYLNIRAALEWLQRTPAVERTLHLCNMLLYYWSSVGSKEALGYFETILKLAADAPPTPEYINALANAGYVSLVLDGKSSGKDYFEQCLALNKAAGNVGDPIKIGTANGLLGWISFDHGDYQRARAYLAAAKENDIAMGAEWALAMSLANQGIMEARLGEFDRAHSLLQEALARHRRIGDLSEIVSVYLRQSMAYIWQNRFEDAADCAARSYPICQEIQADGLFATFYHATALIAFHDGEYVKANQLLREALLIRQKIGVPRYILQLLEATIQIVIGQNDLNQGLMLAGTITAYRQTHNLVAPPVEKQLVDDAIALARQQLTPTVATAAWAAGAAMTLDEALAYALAVQ